MRNSTTFRENHPGEVHTEEMTFTRWKEWFLEEVEIEIVRENRLPIKFDNKYSENDRGSSDLTIAAIDKNLRKREAFLRDVERSFANHFGFDANDAMKCLLLDDESGVDRNHTSIVQRFGAICTDVFSFFQKIELGDGFVENCRLFIRKQKAVNTKYRIDREEMSKRRGPKRLPSPIATSMIYFLEKHVGNKALLTRFESYMREGAFEDDLSSIRKSLQAKAKPKFFFTGSRKPTGARAELQIPRSVLLLSAYRGDQKEGNCRWTTRKRDELYLSLLSQVDGPIIKTVNKEKKVELKRQILKNGDDKLALSRLT